MQKLSTTQCQKFRQNNGADDEEDENDKNHDECQINNAHCKQMADSEILSAVLLLSQFEEAVLLCAGSAMTHKKQLLVNL